MGRKKDEFRVKERRSPTSTVASLTDAFVAELNVPALPEIPQRLAEAITKRITAYLYFLKEAKHERYIKPFEVRLIRDAHRAVLTGFELDIRDARVHYATFRRLVEDLGYERVDVGFKKEADD